MITTTLYPNGHTSSSAATIGGGAASFEAALADNLDTTFVDLAAGGGFVVLTLDDYAVPGGDMIKSATVKIRYRVLTIGAWEWLHFNANDGVNPPYSILSNQDAPGGGSALLVSKALLGTPDGAAFTNTRLNALVVGPATDPPVHHGLTSATRIYAISVDVVVLAPPVVSAVLPSGTITSHTPTVTWTFTGDSGEPQTYLRVKVFREADAAAGGFDPETSGAAVWDSGDVANPFPSRPVGATLDPGQFRLYVKGAQIRKQWSAWTYSSITIANPPNVPALTAPTSGAVVDTGAGFRASWTYTHPDGTAEASWALRRATDGGAYQYWRESDSTWQAAIVWNPGATVLKDFLGAAWPNNHTYAWSVSVQDALSDISGFGSDATIVATAKPTANITAPIGAVTTTTRPAITWSYADGASRPQSAYQVKVFLSSDAAAPDGGTPFYDSGIVAGAAGTVTAPVDFPADATSFTAYVKVLAGGQWSDWDSSVFDCSVTAPAAPVSVTAVEQTASNSVLVTVTGAAEAGYTALRTVVERQDPDGVWRTVRGATALVPNVSHVATVVDYEAVARANLTYRAKIFGTLTGGGLVAGAYLSATPLQVNPTSWWIKDVLDPSRNAALPVGDGLSITDPVTAGTFDTYGDAAIVISEASPRAARFTMSIWTKTGALRNAVIGVVVQGRTLLVQDVLNQQWYVQVNGDVIWKFLRAISSAAPRAHAYTTDIPVVVVDIPPVS